MQSKMSDEIIYPFPNFNGCTVEVWEWASNLISQFIIYFFTIYNGWDYLFMLAKQAPGNSLLVTKRLFSYSGE